MDKKLMCCDKPMRHTLLGYYECEVCKRQIEDELGLIKRTLKEHPNANAMYINVISYELPTAARAFSCINLPATKLSAILYSCWNIILPSSGSENLTSSVDGFPFVKSLFIFNPPLSMHKSISVFQ